MSQNDFNIANQGFPSFRSDLNGALQALASNSAGTTAPSTTYAYQWWYDETTDILKIRNADNDAWIDFATFDQLTDTWSLASLSVTGTTTLTGALVPQGGITNLVRIQVITSSGTYTPSTGATKALVYATGGGGGGGSVDGQGSGTEAWGMAGSGAGTAIKFISSLASSYTVTIGAGGARGTTGPLVGAGDGGTTTFTDGAGLTLTANGGIGGGSHVGVSGTSFNGGNAGGTATGGDINIQGEYSGLRRITAAVPYVIPTAGGSYWGGAAVQTQTTASDSTTGIDATVIGAGGTGAVARDVTQDRVGGFGADGAVVIFEYL